jgi:hypothetical protein
VTDLTPEELDEARIEEATRRARPDILAFGGKTFAHHLCDVFNEGWTPPPKVDPDLLAAREWLKAEWSNSIYNRQIDAGAHDFNQSVRAFLAAIKHGRGSRPEIVWPDHPDVRSAAYISGWIDAVEAIRAQVEGKS